MLCMPSGTSKHSYRGHRLVVLPDYQNLGFGTKINEFLGENATISYDVYVKGKPTIGTVSISNKKPTFTPKAG